MGRNKIKELKMAIYDGLQSILNAALGKYQSEGFRLVEDSDHFLLLYYQDSLLDVFNQDRVTVPTIHEACRGYLERISGN